MAGQSYKGFDRKEDNFHDFTYLLTWVEGIFSILDASIHEIKTGSYR